MVTKIFDFKKLHYHEDGLVRNASLDSTYYTTIIIEFRQVIDINVNRKV